MTVAEFFHMGGYGLYVWGSFGMMALLLLAEPVMVHQQRKSVIQRLRRIARLHEAESK